MEWNRHKLLWDGNGTDKHVPWTTLEIATSVWGWKSPPLEMHSSLQVMHSNASLQVIIINAFDQSTTLLSTQNIVAMHLHAWTTALPLKASCAQMETVFLLVGVESCFSM